MSGIYSGGAQQEAWFGKYLKIGFAAQDWLPNDNNYNLWYGGRITNWTLGGGTKEVESVACMGGFNKQYQKQQGDYELSLDVIQTDTHFDEMLMGDAGFYVDFFDDYADSTALQSSWAEATDASAATLDTTNFKSGFQGALLTWTNSASDSAEWASDISTHLGTTQDISGFAGTAAANADRGRAEAVIYIATATDLANMTTISLRIGSSSTVYSQYDYTVSGNCVVGWNRIIYDLTTADSSAGSTAWDALDYCQIRIVQTGSSSSGITVDRIRIFDPVITTAMIPDSWRVILFYEVSSDAAVGEKRRWVMKSCTVSSFEPSSDAADHQTATITLKFPALNASGNANLKIEHTPDASEAALTALSNY